AGFAAALRAAGRAAVAISAADCTPGLADGYLAISQSGRSRETVEALAAAGLPAGVAPGRRVALTNDPDGPLATVADLVLPLGCGEDSRVSTLSYTATVQALALLADALTGSPPSTVDLPNLAETLLKREIELAVDALA